ncbi:MAG: DUF4097 family beta strand repeat-containing protein [Balneolales bacterium]
MKAYPFTLASALFSLLLAVPALAQEQQVVIPLSEPGQPGTLELSVIRGSVSVSGYDGDEVIINYDGDEEPRQSREETEDGLRRISPGNSGFEASESNNTVTVSNLSPIRRMDFEISVPYNFSLELALVTGDDITVDNINGEIAISHVNGGITLTNVGGSATVNTVNGDITATNREVAEQRPMAFSSVNGDIDVTLPQTVQVSARMNSEMGEIYTDFDMELDEGDDQTGSPGSNAFNISVNRWMNGTINGGGPEYMFKTLRGDIFIRRQ